MELVKEKKEEEDAPVVEIRIPIDDCKISSVTVFQDRAEVVRRINFEAKDVGSYALIVEGLTDRADTQSIRVKPFGKIASCTIQEVSFDVHHRPKHVDGPDAGAEVQIRNKIRAIEQEVTQLQAEQKRTQQQENFVNGYIQGMLTSQTHTDSVTRQVVSSAPAVGTDIEMAKKLLDFYATQASASDDKKAGLREQIRQQEELLAVQQAELGKIVNLQDIIKRKLTVSSRDVTVLVSTASEDVAGVLEMSYIVHGASWTPFYDLRVNAPDQSQQEEQEEQKEQEEQRTIAVTYYGVVRQTSGENWNSVHLSLSTAAPATGGCPPAPPTKVARWQPRNLRSMPAARSMQQQMQMQVPMQSAMPQMERRLSISALECESSDDSEVEEDEDDGIEAVATARVKQDAAGGSSTYEIERKASIATDNKEHKVTIAIFDLKPQFRYFATPALEEKAYLQARATNTSAYTLLPCSSASIFIGGSFIAKTALKHTSPGQGINLFLGVDPAVKVQHRLMKQQDNQGSASKGLFRAKEMSKKAVKYCTILHNTKLTPIDITVVELLPRSSDDKIKVELKEPANVDTQGLSSSADGEAALKSGSTMRNKVTNNIVFNRSLAAQQKMELPFAYEIQWPHDSNSGKVEVV